MNSPFDQPGPVIPTDIGLAAVDCIAQLARPDGNAYAIAGGIAMHLYGFTRATKDVDVLAERPVDLPVHRELTFGGRAHLVDAKGNLVEIDVIVRNDEQQDIYVAALGDRIAHPSGHPVISPEWMVILKHLAGRGKDHIDLLWLLRADSLVDRTKVSAHLRKTFGKAAYWPLQNLESLYLEADLLKARDERGK